MDVMSPTETDADLIGQAAAATQKCNWIVGRCAAEWKSRDDDRTDQQFADLISRSRSTVAQCRRVWECFGEEAECYGRNNDVAWSFWRDMLEWADAAAVFRWMMSNQATPKEAAAYQRMLAGDDLTRPADESRETCDTLSEAIARTDVVEHDPAENAYAPFRLDAGRAPRDETHQDAEPSKEQQDATGKVRQQLTNLTKLARAVAPEFACLVADHMDRLAECLRQGEREKNIVGLDKPTIDSLIRSASE